MEDHRDALFFGHIGWLPFQVCACRGSVLLPAFLESLGATGRCSVYAHPGTSQSHSGGKILPNFCHAAFRCPAYDLPLVTGVSTPSALPGAQPTATITRIPQELETLIGLNYIFKIHRVKQGESLDLLAQINGTTTAALFAVNYQLSTPLKAQQVIILPVNQSDVSGLPPFEPYRVAEDTSLATLAAEQGVDPTQIQFYNGLGNSDQLHAGEWIILPREK